MSRLSKFLIDNFTSKNLSFCLKEKYRIRKLSSKEIYLYSKKLHSFFVSLNIHPGDKIIIKCQNCPEWVIVFLSCIIHGIVLVPVDYNLGFDFDLKIMNTINPKLIIYSKDMDINTTNLTNTPSFLNSRVSNHSSNNDNPTNGSLINEISVNDLKIPFIYIEDLIKIIENLSETRDGDTSQIKLDSELKNKSETESTIKNENNISNDISNEVSEESVAEIIFTSGSTANPKGVILKHKNIGANILAAKPIIDKWKIFLKFIINPKLLSLVPLSHMYGQVIGIFIPLMMGCSVYYLNSYVPEEIHRFIKKEKIWILGALPRVITLFKDHLINEYNLNSEKFKSKYKRLRNVRWWIRYPAFIGLKWKIGISLVAIISGGARLDNETEDFFRCLAFAVFQGYGLTETAPLVTLTDPAKNKEGSVGNFLDEQNVKVISGEVFIKGESVADAYISGDKKIEIKSQNGWFKTGDLVEVDKNGDVFFKGRVDDMIVRPDGLNVYPYDIEEAVKSSSDLVKDCVVFGIEKDKSTVDIHAVLLLDLKKINEQFIKVNKDKENTPKEIRPERLLEDQIKDISEESLSKDLLESKEGMEFQFFVRKIAEDIIKNANLKLHLMQKINSFSIWNEPDFPRTSTFKPKKNEIREKVLLSIVSLESKAGKEKDETIKITGRKVTENGALVSEIITSDIGKGELEKSKESQVKEIEYLPDKEIFGLLNSVKSVSLSDLNQDLKLDDDLGFDSLDFIALSSVIEEKLNINSEDINIKKGMKVGELKELLKNPPGETAKIPFYYFPYSLPFIIIKTIFQCLLMPFILMLYKERRYGIENLKDIKKPTVFISNHTSVLDALVILYALPFNLRMKFTTVMSIEYHFNHYFYKTGSIFRRAIEAIGFYTFISLFLNVVPLSRTHGFKQSLENIAYLLDKGWNVLIFPEGMVTKDGNIGDFEAGIGMIAKDMKVPIVPVRIDGLRDILHNGILPFGHWPRRVRVEIKFGKQIFKTKGSYKEIANELREIVESM